MTTLREKIEFAIRNNCFTQCGGELQGMDFATDAILDIPERRYYTSQTHGI
jgi:hypothetical protein